MVTDAGAKSSEGLRVALLEERRRKKAMFLSRRPTTQVVEAELKGIEEFTPKAESELKLRGVDMRPFTERMGEICDTLFMSGGGHCITLEDVLQNLRRQDKLRIVYHSS
jgi:hypothetical protein